MRLHLLHYCSIPRLVSTTKPDVLDLHQALSSSPTPTCDGQATPFAIHHVFSITAPKAPRGPTKVSRHIQEGPQVDGLSLLDTVHGPC